MAVIDERAMDVARYIAGDYELQRDCDAHPGTTATLYGYEPGVAFCVLCLRRFSPSKREGRGGRGGVVQVYCSSACRSRAGDARRRDIAREWRLCVACGGPFVAQAEDQVVCPAPWPAAPSVRNPACAAQRRQETNRAAQRRRRAAVRAESAA